jgi:beta-glucanase (GH16 family)
VQAFFIIAIMQKRWLTLFAGLLILANSFAQPMAYVATKAEATNFKSIENGITPVLKLQVQTIGSFTPLSLLQINFKTGSKKWDNAAVKVYYTGTEDSFYTAMPFGGLQSKNGQMFTSGEQELFAGQNYFWVVFETKSNANPDKIPTLQFVSCTTGLQDYQQTWADEFNKNGKPDSASWRFEHGFVRNEEDQWYQEDNAICKNGILLIEARRDSIPNPRYEEGSKDWRRNRKYIRYTASSINTSGKYAWTYGRLEMKARLDTNAGCWPAWWALGTGGGAWPNNGEIDMMEFYRGKILANYAVGTQRQYNAKWYSTSTPVGDFKKQNWTDSFHNWRMDWDSVGIAIYLDEVLLNYQPQSVLYNRNGNNDYFPFRHPQYMLLNFAIGGQNGGDPSNTIFPRKYEIDYVRVLQKVSGKFSQKAVHTQ